MSACATDYRTELGVSRRAEGETTLGKYMRVAEINSTTADQRAALPYARPEVTCTLTSDEYLLLLDILDELFLLEQAARYADRKASTIARGRLFRAVGLEARLTSEQIEQLYVQVNATNAPFILRIGTVLFPDREFTPNNYRKALEADIVSFPIVLG